MKSSSSKWALAFSSFLFLAAVLSPTAASAQGNGPFALPPGANGFGGKSQFVFDGTANFNITKTSGQNTEITIMPALDFFIIQNVTVGGAVGLTTRSGRNAPTTVLLEARAGYNFNLTDKLSLWPTAGLLFAHTSATGGGDSSTYFDIYAPFLFHVVQHFFLGLGPFLNVGLGDGDPNMFGIQSVIGGWF